MATPRARPIFPELNTTTLWPDDPADSLLQPGADGSDLLLVLFLAPWNLMVAVGWIIFAKSAAVRR